MIRLYVIGAEGQVARSLREAAAAYPDFIIGFGARPRVDLLEPTSVAAAITAFKPNVVINPAAFTSVDGAEAKPDLAFAINRDGAQAVACASREQGAPIIHMSTDYVFDGKKQGAYFETDEAGPQGVYGRSKLDGENAVAHANPRHVILRTSWVYAPFGNNFVRTLLRLADERDRLRVVNDQRGCPTYAPDIAVAIMSIARKLVNWQPDYAGVTHLAGPDAMTRYEFAREIFRLTARRGGPSPSVEAISTSEYPTTALRPANSQLSTQRLRSVFDIILPPMYLSLANCLERIFAERGSR
jgi:dTDP-4-dehydrorhamnose reductase